MAATEITIRLKKDENVSALPVSEAIEQLRIALQARFFEILEQHNRELIAAGLMENKK